MRSPAALLESIKFLFNISIAELSPELANTLAAMIQPDPWSRPSARALLEQPAVADHRGGDRCRA
jgi:hypothetical protein